MSENKNQTQKIQKTLSVSDRVKSLYSKKKIALILVIFGFSVLLVLAVFYFSITLLKVFPEFILVPTANDLLKIMIEADGIFLGFVGIIFAQLLSSIMDQQNILYQSILDKGDKTSNKNKSLKFLDNRKDRLAIIAVATFFFLLLSIFASMANIAKNSNLKPTDTFASFGILFGPLLFTMIAVMLLMLAFIALPLRPPLEEKKNS